MFIDTNIDVPMSAPEGISRERIFDATPHSKVREEEGKRKRRKGWNRREWKVRKGEGERKERLGKGKEARESEEEEQAAKAR